VTRALAPLLALSVACKPVALPAPDVTDVSGLHARALAEPPPGPSYVGFDALLTAPGQRLALDGLLVVSPPDRFRVELKGPIGPAQVIVTCDGTDVRAWVAPQNKLYLAEDADASLGALLGGGADLRGAAVATSLLLGRVPDLGTAPVLTAVGPIGQAAWARPDGARLLVGIDGRTAHLVDARAEDSGAAPLFLGTWKPAAAGPEALTVRLPSLEVSVDVRFKAWSPATPTDAAFRMEAPAGAVVSPLSLVPAHAGEGEGAGP